MHFLKLCQFVDFDHNAPLSAIAQSRQRLNPTSLKAIENYCSLPLPCAGRVYAVLANRGGVVTHSGGNRSSAFVANPVGYGFDGGHGAA